MFSMLLSTAYAQFAHSTTLSLSMEAFMKVGERNMYHLQDGKKANVRSSYEILLPWVRGRHPWEVQISAFAKNMCSLRVSN
jgi:hypothetical protein